MDQRAQKRRIHLLTRRTANGGRIGLKTDHPLIIPAPAPSLPLTTTLRRERLGINPQGDAESHITPSDSPTNGNIDAQPVTKQVIPSMEHNSQPVAEGSLPTSTSNGPVKLRITSCEFTHCSGGSGHIERREKETKGNGGRAFYLEEGRYHEIIAPDAEGSGSFS